MIFDDWEEKSEGQQIYRHLFWEYNMSEFDWHAMQKLVVQRVIERGGMNDFYAAIRLYGGLDKFKEIIKKIRYLSDRNISFISIVFDLKKEELLCYTRKQWREKHLSSLEP
jgi:hypothetical protein